LHEYLSPNHTLELTTGTSAFKKYVAFVVILSHCQMFSGYYICKIIIVIIACSLTHGGWSLSKMHKQWLLYLQIKVAGGHTWASSLVVLCI